MSRLLPNSVISSGLNSMLSADAVEVTMPVMLTYSPRVTCMWSPLAKTRELLVLEEEEEELLLLLLEELKEDLESKSLISSRAIWFAAAAAAAEPMPLEESDFWKEETARLKRPISSCVGEMLAVWRPERRNSLMSKPLLKCMPDHRTSSPAEPSSSSSPPSPSTSFTR